jgi:D-arginine dehydrogenase
LSPRQALYIGRPDQSASLRAKAAEDATRDFVELNETQVVEVQPVVRPGYAVGGLLDPVAQDIDVAGVRQAFVRLLRQRGGRIDTSAPTVSVRPSRSGWTVETSAESHETDVVVNAAGAWGDVVAEMAGIDAIGLTPKRRTAFMVSGSDRLTDTPLVADVDMEFYLKPDGEQFLCSLAEEVPEAPCDARPREIDVALAIERINAATTLDILHVRSSWTGQRTLAPDGAPVCGFDPDADGFFWLVGQGGTGIQSSPGAAAYATSMIMSGAPDEVSAALNVDPAALSPARFR